MPDEPAIVIPSSEGERYFEGNPYFDDAAAAAAVNRLRGNNATAVASSFSLSFSGEACGGDLFNVVIRAIRATYVVRLNGADVVWGHIEDRSTGTRLHYREWDEGAGVAVGPLRTMLLENVEEIYVY